MPGGAVPGGSACDRIPPGMATRSTFRLMRSLRPLLRGTAMATATLGLYLAFLVGRAALVSAPRRRARWSSAMQSRWGRALCAILGVRLERSGSPPRPPFFLVSNHLSYLDVLVLSSAFPCVFVAKAEVRGWPVLGRLSAAVGTIFVDRARRSDVPRVLRDVEAAFALGRGVVLFPEGTSSDGSSVLPFRSPLLDLPARRGEPVYAAALFYRTPAGEPSAAEAICWWSDIAFAPHLRRLLGLRRIEARLVFSERPLHHADRKELAVELGREVARLHARLAAERPLLE